MGHFFGRYESEKLCALSPNKFQHSVFSSLPSKPHIQSECAAAEQERVFVVSVIDGEVVG